MPSSSVGLGKVLIVLIHYMVMGGGVGEGRVSYPISGWPGAHYIVQADSLASVSRVLWLQVCAIAPHLYLRVFLFYKKTTMNVCV